MLSKIPYEKCANIVCPHAKLAWLRRWRPVPGIRLNHLWFCSMDCFEQGAIGFFSQFNLKPNRSPAVRYRLPLGLLLLSKGLISAQHLQEALKAQRESQTGRLGEWLREQGILSEEQLTGALGAQWGFPVFRLAQSAGFAECASMAPLHLMETSRMAPVHYMPNSRTLYLAFSDGIDFSALRALEQVLECNAQPCVIGETEMQEALDAIRRMPRPSEMVMDFPGSPQKIASTAREWAESNRAGQVRAAMATESLWIRIQSTSTSGHLVFRLQERGVDAVL